jgi:hypothetical protein
MFCTNSCNTSARNPSPCHRLLSSPHCTGTTALDFLVASYCSKTFSDRRRWRCHLHQLVLLLLAVFVAQATVVAGFNSTSLPVAFRLHSNILPTAFSPTNQYSTARTTSVQELQQCCPASGSRCCCCCCCSASSSSGPTTASSSSGLYQQTAGIIEAQSWHGSREQPRAALHPARAEC